jgi:hypothetical protein
VDLNVRPVPIPDPISAFYWESAKLGRLSVQGFEGLDVLQPRASPSSAVTAVHGRLPVPRSQWWPMLTDRTAHPWC